MKEPKKILIDTDVFEIALPNYQGETLEYISVNQLKEWIEENTNTQLYPEYYKSVELDDLLKFIE